MSYLQYNTTTGEILGCSNSERLPIEGTNIIEVAPDFSPFGYYVDVISGEFLVRQELPAAPTESVGGFVIPDLPSGTLVKISGPVEFGHEDILASTVADQNLVVQTLSSGTYNVELNPPWPLMDQYSTIHVSDGPQPVPSEGDLVITIVPPIVKMREVGEARANDAASVIQIKVVADTPAQGMIYNRKESEARSFLSLADPETANPMDYPMLAADMMVDQITLAQAAQNVLIAAQVFALAGSIIEGMRRGAIKAIRTSDNSAEIEAAIATITIAQFESTLMGYGINPQDIY